VIKRRLAEVSAYVGAAMVLGTAPWHSIPPTALLLADGVDILIAAALGSQVVIAVR